jgi:hypothetical protein
MWPGEQPPGGEQNPQNQSQNPYQQPGYQQPNPYQQPGYQQSNPYASQPGQQPQQPQWSVPTVPMGSNQPPPPQKDRKTMITVFVATGAVVVAAGVTGFLVLGGKNDNNASSTSSPSPSASAAPNPNSANTSGGDGDPRGTQGAKPVIPGWKVVLNPKWGTAFDVPPSWSVDSPGMEIGFDDNNKPDGPPLIVMSAPAYDQQKWCTSDDNHDGTPDDTALGTAGTKGQNGAKNTAEPARNDSAWWVFGGYTHQKAAEKKLLKIGDAKPYTTKSGVHGSVATTYSQGVQKLGKCDSDGKATTFAFKNSNGDFVSWTFYGAKGVKGEVPDATVQKILSTVRLHGTPQQGS